MSRHVSAKRRRNISRRSIVGDHDADIVIVSAKRKVRIIVHGFMGKDPTDSAINLDAAAVDKLIARLSNIRASSSRPLLRKGGVPVPYPEDSDSGVDPVF